MSYKKLGTTLSSAALLAAVFFSSPMQAQTDSLTTVQAVNPASAEVVSLNEAVRYALQHKAEARKARLDIQNAEYKITEARSNALPQIAVNGSLTYNAILQKSALPGDFIGAPGTVVLVPFGQKWGSNVAAGLNQQLFNQQVFIGLKAAKSTREFYQINAELTNEQLIERVASAYYQVFVQQQQLETIDASLANTRKIKNVIQSLFDNGLAKKIDLDRMNVNLTNLETSKQQLINAVQLQQNALKFYMGMPIETPIRLVREDFEPREILADRTLDTAQLTEIRLLNKRKELLTYNKKAEEAAYYPSLSLTANYGFIGTGSKFPIFTTKEQGTYWSDFSAIGLNLNIPVFSGFRIKSRVQQAQIELDKLDEDIRDANLSLNLQYQNARTQIENDLIAIENQQQNVQLAENVLNDTRSNYQYGLASLTDLLDAETALINARNNYSDSVLQLKLAEVQLWKANGTIESKFK